MIYASRQIVLRNFIYVKVSIQSFNSSLTQSTFEPGPPNQQSELLPTQLSTTPTVLPPPSCTPASNIGADWQMPNLDSHIFSWSWCAPRPRWQSCCCVWRGRRRRGWQSDWRRPRCAPGTWYRTRGIRGSSDRWAGRMNNTIGKDQVPNIQRIKTL